MVSRVPLRFFAQKPALYYLYIVVEVTLNTAEYGSQRSDQPENVSFEPTIRGLRCDIFD